MIEANDQTFQSEVLESDQPVLVDFSAAWCGPCKMQKPVLEKFSAAHPHVKVVMVDVDQSPRVAQQQGVQAMPTLMLFNGGERKAVAQGLQNVSRLERMVAGA